MDPGDVDIRKGHRLRRNIYRNPGPNCSWHCDRYDKLKPFGFPIHGRIDGWSRKIILLYVMQSHNQLNIVATYFLDAVEVYDGCLVDLVTDLKMGQWPDSLSSEVTQIVRDMYHHLEHDA